MNAINFVGISYFLTFVWVLNINFTAQTTTRNELSTGSVFAIFTHHTGNRFALYICIFQVETRCNTLSNVSTNVNGNYKQTWDLNLFALLCRIFSAEKKFFFTFFTHSTKNTLNSIFHWILFLKKNFIIFFFRFSWVEENSNSIYSQTQIFMLCLFYVSIWLKLSKIHLHKIRFRID